MVRPSESYIKVDWSQYAVGMRQTGVASGKGGGTSGSRRMPAFRMGGDLHIVRFEVFTAVTMKNGVFWDIKSQFVLHRRHMTSLLQRPDG
jgi:hypothetical protein